MTEPDWLAERFEEHRPRLRAVAYRMLGSMTEADDAVQDAWLRLARTDADAIDNLGGWLTTVVGRVCLDVLRTRKARREDPIGVHLPEPLIGDPDGVDPEQAAVLADSVGLALLVVLETLTPAERLAFVLHDTFGLPFDEIAPIVGRSTTATRQLASRGRRRVRGAAASPDVDVDRQRVVVHAFVAAARDGDFAALLRVLDPDVVIRADAGAMRAGAAVSREVRGAQAVAETALGFRRFAAGGRDALVNGAAGLVVFAGDRPYAVLGFTVRGDRIVEIDILADPARIERLGLTSAGPTV
ncbi:MAG TPA: RNA polymerase sigma factor SigJ [Candidatus Limnocylindrales bacterium]|jgi:RNA polymerase sigma factor (sigma-70 family)